MTRLWVRNLIGIVVVVVAVAILGIFELYPPVSTYRKTLEPELTVARGASVPLRGQTWRLESVRKITALPKKRFGASIPNGANLIAVTLERSGPPIEEPCVGFLTDGHRRWRDQASSGESFPVSPDATGFCSRPGPLQFNFLLPSDVTPTALDISGSRDAILLRITL